MKTLGRLAASALLLLVTGLGLAVGEVVVLRGGARIELKKPPLRQGNIVLLTRSDGTLFSVHDSDIDWTATAAARAERASARPSAPAVTPPPESPAQAARASRAGPKARVKLTDADVQHPEQEASAEETEKKTGEQAAAGAQLEVSNYTREKSGANVVVRGDLRNTGGAPALNSRMTVTAMDEKGEKIASSEAGLSNALIAPGASVSFSATVPVGERVAASLRFEPQWIAPAPPAAGPAPTAAPGTPLSRPTQAPPAPTPTPYGQGTLYAPPPAAASTTPPADSNRGYIPGMSEPQSQPKPPK